jgi:hypothetical protein
MGVDYYNCEVCNDIYCDAGYYGYCGNCEASLCGSCYDEMRKLHGELGEDHEKAGDFGEDAPKCCSVCDGSVIDDAVFIEFLSKKLGHTREELEAEFRKSKEG